MTNSSPNKTGEGCSICKGTLKVRDMDGVLTDFDCVCVVSKEHTTDQWESLECGSCKKIKPTTEFWKHFESPQKRYGFSYTCKECARVIDARRYYKNREKRLADRKARYQMEKDKFNETSKRMRAKYPEKWKARMDLRNAVKQGKILKLPCSVCGSPLSQGHHEDYSKSLEVIWLCTKHHMERHRKYNADELLKQK